jgi:hypothetical protein
VVVGLLDRREVRLAVGDIESDGQQRVAVFLREVLEARGVAGRGSDLVAALKGRYRPLSAETT